MDDAERDTARGEGSNGLAQSGRMVIILTTLLSPLKRQRQEGEEMSGITQRSFPSPKMSGSYLVCNKYKHLKANTQLPIAVPFVGLEVPGKLVLAVIKL